MRLRMTVAAAMAQFLRSQHWLTGATLLPSPFGGLSGCRFGVRVRRNGTKAVENSWCVGESRRNEMKIAQHAMLGRVRKKKLVRLWRTAEGFFI